MNVNIRVIILSSFVFLLLTLMIVRSCKRPPIKGQTLYENHCASCHGKEGEGFRNLFPPLTDSVYLKEHMDEFACIVGFGLDKPIVVNGVTFTQPMAGIEGLNPTQIANVGNYIYEKWSGTNKKFTPKEIETALANCQ